VADRFATTGELPLSPLTVSVPVTFPAAAGVTATEKLLDCPGESARGRLTPEKLNCEFDTLAWVMFTATVPVFETETLCVAFLPTVTVPKLTLLGVNPNIAATVCEDTLTRPAHPFRRSIEGSKARRRSISQLPCFARCVCGATAPGKPGLLFIMVLSPGSRTTRVSCREDGANWRGDQKKDSRVLALGGHLGTCPFLAAGQERKAKPVLPRGRTPSSGRSTYANGEYANFGDSCICLDRSEAF